jgi:hypothetical protein
MSFGFTGLQHLESQDQTQRKCHPIEYTLTTGQCLFCSVCQHCVFRRPVKGRTCIMLLGIHDSNAVHNSTRNYEALKKDKRMIARLCNHKKERHICFWGGCCCCCVLKTRPSISFSSPCETSSNRCKWPHQRNQESSTEDSQRAPLSAQAGD